MKPLGSASPFRRRGKPVPCVRIRRRNRFVSRFQSAGLHPKLSTGSQLRNSPHVAPGSYDLTQYGDFSERNLHKRMQGPNWQQALYTEHMAKIPHSSFKETYERRKEDERRLGPGAYPMTDFLLEADRRPHCIRGALDQLSPRFPTEKLVGRCHSYRTRRTFFRIGQGTASRCLWDSRREVSEETLATGKHGAVV